MRKLEVNTSTDENIIYFPKENQPTAYDNINEIALECFKKIDFKGSERETIKKFFDIRNNLLKELSLNKVKNEEPRYNIKNTVFDDYIICLEDGQKMQMLKRHLKTKYNMTFQQYKQKWGLPIDYPYVCKNYSKVRAKIANKRKKKAG